VRRIKQFRIETSSPFPCLSANGVTVCHVVTLVYIPLVSVIVLYDGWLQSVYILITEITFCWRTMHICQHVYILFVFPNHSCQVTLHLSLYFQFGQTVPRQFIAFVCKLSDESGEDKNCPCRVRVPNFQSL
jgi:hypothetical protein